MKKLTDYILKALKEYYNLTEEEIYEKIENNMEEVNEEWYKSRDVISFYKETDNYVFGLASFNTKDRVDRSIYPAKDGENAKILDFGGGIGEIGMRFSKKNTVFYYDISPKIEKFARFLSKKTNRKLTFLTEKEVFNQKYNCIFLLDVLEHLENPMETLKKLCNCLGEKDVLITTGLDFLVSYTHPMHLKENFEFRDEYHTFMKKNFTLYFLHCTVDGNIQGWVKKR